MADHSTEEEAKIQEVINRLGRAQPWIEAYAKQLGVSYDDLMENAAMHVQNDWHYWNEGPLFDGVDLDPLFWEHYQDVTNTIVPEDKQFSFFSCAC